MKVWTGPKKRVQLPGLMVRTKVETETRTGLTHLLGLGPTMGVVNFIINEKPKNFRTIDRFIGTHGWGCHIWG